MGNINCIGTWKLIDHWLVHSIIEKQAISICVKRQQNTHNLFKRHRISSRDWCILYTLAVYTIIRITLVLCRKRIISSLGYDIQGKLNIFAVNKTKAHYYNYMIYFAEIRCGMEMLIRGNLNKYINIRQYFTSLCIQSWLGTIYWI